MRPVEPEGDAWWLVVWGTFALISVTMIYFGMKVLAG
mgnify:CR=1 FL=1